MLNTIDIPEKYKLALTKLCKSMHTGNDPSLSTDVVGEVPGGTDKDRLT